MMFPGMSINQTSERLSCYQKASFPSAALLRLANNHVSLISQFDVNNHYLMAEVTVIFTTLLLLRAGSTYPLYVTAQTVTVVFVLGLFLFYL